MKLSKLLIFGMLLASLGVPTSLLAESNVALGATVTLDGTFFECGWGSQLDNSGSTVVDGVFANQSNQWDGGDGTTPIPVWWDSRTSEPWCNYVDDDQFIQVDLDAVYVINSLIIQVDDNDAYNVWFRIPGTSAWELAWAVPNYDWYLGTDLYGMQTRPNPLDDTERFSLLEPIVTDAFIIDGALPSDELYAVSEFQAFGDPLNQYSCMGFEPPMANGPVRVRGNRALPLKAHVYDKDGFEITAADVIAPPVLQIWYEYDTPDEDLLDEVDALPAGQGDEGNQFVYTGERWQFNLKTGDYAKGTYTVMMVSGDSSEYSIGEPTCIGQFVVQ